MITTCLLSFRRRAKSLWGYLSLALAATILLAACGGGTTGTTPTPTPTSQPTLAVTATTAPPSPTPSPTPTVVTVKIIEQNERYSFSPATLNIKAGTQVVWTNDSDAPHTVTSDVAGVFASTTNIAPHQSFMFTFSTAGTFPYHCNIHPYMKAAITVTS